VAATIVLTERKLACVVSVLFVFGLGAFDLFASCSNAVYLGFDSRLKTDLVGRLPATKEQVQGFEIVRGKPLVAFPHLLVAFGSDKSVSFTPPDTIVGITADSTDHIRLQTANGIQMLKDSGFKPDTSLTSTVEGHLSNSGNRVFLDTLEKDSQVHLVARRDDGTALPIANVKGALHAISWDELGLAAVIDNSLFVWELGGSDFVRLKSDVGLEAARSVCLVGPRRAVVTLPNVVVLVTEDTQTPIVGFAARCAWAHSILYLLDERGGLIWSVTGLEQLGKRSADQAYAKKLLGELPANADENAPRFLEAARILGCQEARKARGATSTSNGRPSPANP
jgi:hypothetical protein